MADGRRFEEIYEKHHGAVLRYLRRRIGTEHAADVTAETFMVAWQRMGDIPEGAELPWLYVVARNLTANHQRRHARRERLAPTKVPVEPDHAEAVGRRDEALTALRALSAGDREVIRLAAWEGLDRDQLALALGCTPSAATVRLHRARKRLHALLGWSPAQRPRPFQAAAAAGMLVAATVLVAVGPRLADIEVMNAASDPVWARVNARWTSQFRAGASELDGQPTFVPGLAGLRTTIDPCPSPPGRFHCQLPDFPGPVRTTGGWSEHVPGKRLLSYSGYARVGVARLVLAPKGANGRTLNLPLVSTGLPDLREFAFTLPDTIDGTLHAFDSGGREIYDSQQDPEAVFG
ncbi:RNA polymerase sigma factor [Spirillospora sp. CA-294931]|uniref:RNA polymerase sigma factor n=1 Tax=Spirillospora sp. CA-294931 TaxID=3240042 RepID=UPI003D92F6B3